MPVAIKLGFPLHALFLRVNGHTLFKLYVKSTSVLFSIYIKVHESSIWPLIRLPDILDRFSLSPPSTSAPPTAAMRSHSSRTRTMCTQTRGTLAPPDWCHSRLQPAFYSTRRASSTRSGMRQKTNITHWWTVKCTRAGDCLEDSRWCSIQIKYVCSSVIRSQENRKFKIIFRLTQFCTKRHVSYDKQRWFFREVFIIHVHVIFYLLCIHYF